MTSIRHKHRFPAAYITGLLFRVCIFSTAIFMLYSCGGTGSRKTGGTNGVTDSVFIPVPKRLSMIFGGDIMAHIPQVYAAYTGDGYDFSETFEYIKPFFDSAGLVILNFETTISADGKYTGYPMFATPPQIASALKKSGADILMLANNHICDKGAEGIRATVSVIEQAGIQYTGAFPDSVSFRERHPLYVSASGINIAILNYTYGTNGMPVPEGMAVNIINKDRIAGDISSVDRSKADHVIVFLHWGEEYARRPSKYQREIARTCHENGADIVIGSHPHVIQPIETILDSTGNVTGVTVYSLGNLVSNQQWRYSDGGMLVKVNLTHNTDSSRNMSVEHLFAWVYRRYERNSQKYTILPQGVADTLLSANPSALAGYNRFIEDSRKLITDGSGSNEIMRAIQ